MEDILQMVSENTGISKSEILKKHGNSDVCESRRIFIYLASKNNSTIRIAEFLGRTRSDIGNQLIKINDEMKIYKSFREKIKNYECLYLVLSAILVNSKYGR